MALSNIILLLVAFIIDSTWGHEIGIRGVRPDLILIALFYTAMGSGVFIATILGFSMGLLEDLNGVSENLGLNAFCNTLICYGVGILKETIYRDSLSSLYFTLLFACLAHATAYCVIYTRFELFESINMMMVVALPSLIYTILVATISLFVLTYRQGRINVRILFKE